MEAISELELNIEERLWGIGQHTVQHCLAYRMLDDDDDFLLRGNIRVYDDIILLDD